MTYEFHRRFAILRTPWTVIPSNESSESIAQAASARLTPGRRIEWEPIWQERPATVHNDSVCLAILLATCNLASFDSPTATLTVGY